MDEYKTCTKCGQIKLITDFRKDKRLKSGYGSQCKQCKYQQTAQWVANNYSRKLEINNKYRIAHPEQTLEKKKEWAEKNKDYIREQGKKYREENKERLKLVSAKWRAENKDSIAKANAEWRRANKEKKRMNDELWWRSNPDKVAARGMRRRAMKKAATIYLVTDKDVRRLLNKPCIYCGAKAEHLDHVLPLYLGGSHSVGNLAPACAPCNLSKGKKLLSVWRYKFLKITATTPANTAANTP